MGNKQTIFQEDILASFQDSTYLTRSEILRIHKVFQSLKPTFTETNGISELRVLHSEIEKMTEFKENPFKEQILSIFTEDKSLKSMNFEEFLEMFSILSIGAPRELKAYYAFKIYDFDGDDQIGRNDLIEVLNRLTRNQLNDEDISFIADKVVDETDLDEDERIDFDEFQQIISRAPDFLSTFHLRL